MLDERSLVEQMNRAWNEMQGILDHASQEGREQLTAEEREKWDRAERDISSAEADLERVQRHQGRDRVDPAQLIDGGNGGVPQPGGGEQRDSYGEAFEAYMRGGMEAVSPEQRQTLHNGFEARVQPAQAAGTNDVGGYTVPQGFRNTLIESLVAYGGILNIAQTITTSSGNKLPWPTVTSGGRTSKGQLLGENTQMGQQIINFSQGMLDAHTYVSNMIPVSYQLLQDSAFDLNSYVPSVAGERIGRALADHLAVGDPSVTPAQPQGIDKTTNTVTAGGTSEITYADMLELEHTVDPAYRGSARYVMHDQVLKELRGITDDHGRPLWVPTPAPGMSPTLNGFPYTVDQGLQSSIATGNQTLYFGDFQRGYVVRQVQDVQAVRLAERFADALQVGFFAYARFDATIQDEPAFAALVQA